MPNDFTAMKVIDRASDQSSACILSTSKFVVAFYKMQPYM